MKPLFNKSFLIAGLLALLLMTVMLIQGSALKTATTPNGILNLEFARTMDRVDEIMNAWKFLNNTALWNTLIDFGFLSAYSFFFSRGVGYLLSLTRNNFLQRHQTKIRKIAWVPGILDGIENVFMLGWLLQMIPSYSPALVFWMVCVKFILAGLLLLLCFPAWIFNAFQYSKKS